ncbi:CynX/NimT family MFS transporter [Brooklawnia cerclae]|uniref:CP family cyanate transporter-like MFS transporter n=1 Tax=Brooklawnia cerclae TaxID=349934 RepID=A0ABX0SH69_9ACTN|nr:MFS transporter [Brooklawnia cerclae]NIH57224.1 CP family cyanate transporter-like MFS transporter [Brooklawnia cerclae]
MPYGKPALFTGLTIIMIAFNLRIAAVAIGPVLPQLQSELGMSTSVAGVLTSLPTLCFALFGFFAPPAASRFGLHRVIGAALVLNIGGQALRILSDSTLGFLAGTTVALAGIGLINVLMPPLVKRHFPRRVGVMTALYTTSQALATMIAGLLTAPLAISMGGWQGPFWVWAGAAAVALVPVTWLVAGSRDRPVRAVKGSQVVRLRDVARTKLGWVLLVFFGMQSAQSYAQFGWLPSIYQSVGFTATQSGQFLTVLNAVVLPVTFLVPVWTQRLGRPWGIVIAMSVLGMLGYAGLIHDPAVLPWLWPMFLALGSGSFSMIMTLLGMRTRTPSGMASLSSFAQSGGYVLAMAGPLLVGVLHDATGTWLVPLLMQLLLFVPLAVSGVIVCRSGLLEDELGLPAEA